TDIFVAAQRGDDFEAVDPRHDQIENHEVRFVAQRLLDAGSSVVDGTHTDVEGLENGLDQADRLQVVIDDQDVPRHFLRALGVGHKIESNHQLDELLPVDRLGEDPMVRNADRGAVGGRQYHPG